VTWRVFLGRGADRSRIASELIDQQVSYRFGGEPGDDLAAAVGREISDGFTRFAVAGQDADVAMVVDSALSAGMAGRVDLALLPGGSRSDLARTFALDQSLPAAVARMAHGTPYLIDIGVVSGGFGRAAFLNSVATGLLAGGPAWFPMWPRPLRVAGPVIVRAGANPVETMASGVLVLNGQFWGEWVGAPRSTLVDGVVDLQLFTGRRRVLARLRPALRTGMHVRSNMVRRLPVAHAEVDQPPSWMVSVDGVRIGRGPFTLAVVAGAVRLAI